MRSVKLWITVGGIAVALLIAGAVFAATGPGRGRSATKPVPARSTSLPTPSPPSTTAAPAVPPSTSLAPPVAAAPTTGTPTTITASKPRTAVAVPAPASADDAARLLQDLNARLQQATPANGPQPMTRAEVQAALDAQLKQLGIDIPHP
jgi:hypothetical protein